MKTSKIQLGAIALAFLLAPIITWAQNSGSFPSGGGGGGTPGGVTTDVQCNVSGALGACLTGVVQSNINGSYSNNFLVPNGTGRLTDSADMTGGILMSSGGSYFYQAGASIAAVAALGPAVSGPLVLGFTPAGADAAAQDTAVARSAAGVMEFNNGTKGTLAEAKLRSLVFGGSPPTLSGTCTSGTQTGGNTAGTFLATCTAQTVILTFAYTAPTGWICNAHDLSTPADALNQTASTTTTATLTGTTVASDKIAFNCMAY